jgi:hypothetical protein
MGAKVKLTISDGQNSFTVADFQEEGFYDNDIKYGRTFQTLRYTLSVTRINDEVEVTLTDKNISVVPDKNKLV